MITAVPGTIPVTCPVCEIEATLALFVVHHRWIVIIVAAVFLPIAALLGGGVAKSLTVGGLDRTDRGFLVEFEERWEAGGQQWYCREMIHCLVDGDRIGELRVYCCGDWDEALQRRHADDVRLLRP